MNSSTFTQSKAAPPSIGEVARQLSILRIGSLSEKSISSPRVQPITRGSPKGQPFLYNFNSPQSTKQILFIALKPS
ncbi:hypothetical protein FGO68_gene2840 [Halteria grandinella]|uniref:Uncharacterized protein n=1 Tax=Halteria grandinella TaxID=5974 RepID=A0A8J8P1U9_HALGN|nr:hypothetical protein FGO68_gene2840 [Halteria grandinella]